ncbi:MAG: Flp pilus assembly protein TadD [Chlamydiales bacterium]|jgi:Flp pilus assembly protein TadD
MHRPITSILLPILLGLLACASTDPARAETMQQAQVASDMGDWRRAAALWYGVYRDDPDQRASVAAPTAEALLGSGDPASALSVVRDSRGLGASGAQLAHVAAQARAELGDNDGAITELRTALREDPDQGAWWWELAPWLWAAGEQVHTREALDRALKLGQDGPELRLLRARVLTALGEDTLAFDAWRELLQRPDRDAVSLLEAARLAVRPSLAIERPQALALGVLWYERAVRAEPQDLQIQREFAYAALLSGDVDKALSAFERASELAPTDQELLSDLAALHVTRGGAKRARELLRRALALETDPDVTRDWQRRIDAIVD